jgi:lipopolysaccharide export system permease protein
MTLRFYIARRFIWMLIRIFALFYALMLMIDVVDQIRSLSGNGVTFAGALYLAAIHVPVTVYSILPLIVILSAIAMFVGLARSSELVVVRAAGQSGLYFLATPVVVAFISGVCAVAVLNPFVAAATKAYDARMVGISRSSDSTLSVTGSGFWLRQGNSEGQSIIRAARTNQDGTQLFGATFLQFDKNGLPLTRIDAREARLEPGAWVLDGAKRWDLTAQNPELSAVAETAPFRVASDLTADGIRDSFGAPSAIPFWSLPDYIRGLEAAGFSARSHRVWFQMELAQPLLLAAMVLVAAGFTMRHARSGKTGSLVLLAVICGLSIFFLRNFAQVLGVNGQIPVALSAWTPPVAATLMAMGLLLHLEDG